MRPGDMIGSGTISGNTREEFGSMLEISWRGLSFFFLHFIFFFFSLFLHFLFYFFILFWKGSNPLSLSGGEERKFLNDNDTVRMSGYGQAQGYRVGLGEVVSKILPANKN